MAKHDGDIESTEKGTVQQSTDTEFDSALECCSAGLDLFSAKRKLRDISDEGKFERLGSLMKLGWKSPLFHYTTAQGIQGIVETGRFYASAAYFMNDSSEIDYGCQMFGEILSKHIKSKDSQNTLAAMVLRSIAQNFQDTNSMRSQLSQTYVVCFCEKPNLLSQWRAYGENGGYSVGFDKEALHKFKAMDGLFHVALRKVIYEQHQQNELLEGILADSIPELESNTIEPEFTKLSIKGKMYCVRMFEYVLQAIALQDIVRFKHPAFEEEKEWRLIAQPGPHKKPSDPDVVAALKFRPSRQVPIPYIELLPDAGLLPITSVRYGPTLERKRAEHALTMLLKKYGYPDIQVDGAEIPVRL